MCRRAAQILCRNLGEEGWPCHYQNQKTYAFERHFTYECVKTCSCERQTQLGMLSPCAEKFYPLTEKMLEENSANDIQCRQK